MNKIAQQEALVKLSIQMKLKTAYHERERSQGRLSEFVCVGGMEGK